MRSGTGPPPNLPTEAEADAWSSAADRRGTAVRKIKRRWLPIPRIRINPRS
jgi:hypothetical protein